ncbi:hypothetical protein K1719_010022 [Acacia pycnantha]|nr:hypothetical protein K1719_010022 [Acacia pycnantha]
MEAIEASEINHTEICTAADALDGSVIFHTIYDVIGFVLYMYQQIPSTVQDMSIEFETMHSEYNQLVSVLAETEVKASQRRYHISKMRDVKLGIRKLEKLMNALSNMKTAIQLIINEIPNIEEIILALGASPRRPQHIYVLSFSHGTAGPSGGNDFIRSKAADGLSRKAIRTLISKGAGSVTYPGSSKLFLLIKAPSSFNQPQHFLPKRDFRYNRKIMPFRLLFKCRNQCQEEVAPTSEDLIWFQCRHVIKGLAMNTVPEE